MRGDAPASPLSRGELRSGPITSQRSVFVKINLIKGQPILTCVAIVVAAVVGMLTGVAVEEMPVANMLATATLTGLIAGSILFAVLKLIIGRKAR